MTAVLVSGGFDDIRSRDVRFLHEAARLGEVTVLLWSDAALAARTGAPPKFPFAERAYVLGALRQVGRVVETDSCNAPPPGIKAAVWADTEDNPQRARFARGHGLAYRVLAESDLRGFPEPPAHEPTAGRRKAVVTGCFDWFHSGHVRFFEEAAGYGDLYVFLGSDKNVERLKGPGHPLFPQNERRFLVGSVRFVAQAQVAQGAGWLDAEAEIRALRPDAFVVNRDGDRDDKRAFCRQLGIAYVVLERKPAPGLPARRSTDLRGF